MAEKTEAEVAVVDEPVLTDPGAEESIIEPTEDVLTDTGKTPAPTDEQKAAAKAEEEALLKADDKTLKPEELSKKQSIIKAKEDAKNNSVPEGNYDLKMPEGMELDKNTLDVLTPTFKEIGLTNAQVQKLAEAYAPAIKAQVERQQQEAIALWDKQSNDWKAESTKMLGANAKTELAFAAKFMDRFGGKEITLEDGTKTNELRVLMAETRIGNNPVLLKAIITAGKLLGEDNFIEGDKNIKQKDITLFDHPSSKATLKYGS